MEWLKVKIDTTPEGIELVSNIFYECGIFTLEIEDSDEFLEILEQTRPQWDFVDDELYNTRRDKSSVSAYIAKNEKAADTVKLIEAENKKLKDSGRLCGSLEISYESMDEEDWAESWKKYFKPIPVGERVLINPVWEDVPEEYKDRTVFTIDPGMSFGTGSHETTRLCLEAMQKYLKAGDSVLDLGCGSGILFITALLLGAERAEAVDIDLNSVHVAKNNAQLNNIQPDKYNIFCGDITKDKGLCSKLKSCGYNVIFANIVADVIIPIIPFVKSIMNAGTVFIASGIINLSATRVIDELKTNGFDIIEVCEDNEWISISARRGTL